MSNNHIRHSGVVGMKWGIRTSYRTNNKFGTPYTGKRKTKVTKKAIKMLTKEHKEYSTLANNYTNKSNKMDGNYDKIVRRRSRSIELAKTYANRSDLLSKKLASITQGRLLAGKDFCY